MTPRKTRYPLTATLRGAGFEPAGLLPKDSLSNVTSHHFDPPSPSFATTAYGPSVWPIIGSLPPLTSVVILCRFGSGNRFQKRFQKVPKGSNGFQERCRFQQEFAVQEPRTRWNRMEPLGTSGNPNLLERTLVPDIKRMSASAL